VLLPAALGQRRLAEWDRIERAVASALVEVECVRTLDRLAAHEGLSDEEISRSRQSVFRLLGSIEVVPIGGAIVQRASHPQPTRLGTLQAIHLATALAWREATGAPLVMATHDPELALAARACGLVAIGG
jgi:hypothetical protein